MPNFTTSNSTLHPTWEWHLNIHIRCRRSSKEPGRSAELEMLHRRKANDSPIDGLSTVTGSHTPAPGFQSEEDDVFVSARVSHESLFFFLLVAFCMDRVNAGNHGHMPPPLSSFHLCRCVPHINSPYHGFPIL